jgi:hypothetical protein
VSLPNIFQQVPQKDYPASVINELLDFERDYVIAAGRFPVTFDAAYHHLKWRVCFLLPPILWPLLPWEDIELAVNLYLPEDDAAAQMRRCGWVCVPKGGAAGAFVIVPGTVDAWGLVRSWLTHGFISFAYLPPFLWDTGGKACSLDCYNRAKFEDIAPTMVSYECRRHDQQRGI